MKFRYFVKGALLASICLLLTACMTPQQRYSRDFAVAKKNFAKQNYNTAFRWVQAPAKSGNADAQYALGYMYYYGRGTLINRRKAAYWFQQAAQQGQPAAKKALQLLYQENQQQQQGQN